MADEPEKQPNTISGLPTDETPPGMLPEPQVTEATPLPVPNPPGANPPHHSVTTPIQYPPYRQVSEDPPAGAVPAVPEPEGQYVGEVDPPDAMTSADPSARTDVTDSPAPDEGNR